MPARLRVSLEINEPKAEAEAAISEFHIVKEALNAEGDGPKSEVTKFNADAPQALDKAVTAGKVIRENSLVSEPEGETPKPGQSSPQTNGQVGDNQEVTVAPMKTDLNDKSDTLNTTADAEQSKPVEVVVDQATDQAALKPLRGTIAGLSKAGLVLTDAMGNLLRPKPGDNSFAFRNGEAYLRTNDGHQLIIVRQPLAQTCQIEADMQGSYGYTVRCTETQSAAEAAPKSPVMRDCFQITSRGSAFTLGYLSKGAWVPYAEVTMDPVGIDRLQHKTYIDGALAIEAIIHLPLVTPVAIIEWLSFKGIISGDATQRTGKSGGMPLDLKLGETRSFTVTASNQDASQAQAKVNAVEQRVTLLEIGPLETQAGRFTLACHLEEGSAAAKNLNKSWYVPGYGIVKTDVIAPGGARLTIEAIEIQQRAE